MPANSTGPEESLDKGLISVLQNFLIPFSTVTKQQHISMHDGKPFFDNSFGDHKMGCPFTLDSRKDEIRKACGACL